MSNEARRHALRSIKTNHYTHVGLWLDRYLEHMPKVPGTHQIDATEARRDHIADVANQLVPRGYSEAFRERQRSLWIEDKGLCVKLRVFRCVGRMIVGMGGGGVMETGIRLERTWGVPLLPGPSLKGVTAAAAHKLIEDPSWHKERSEQPERPKKPIGDSAAYLFGTMEQAGRVTFHDAWWIPKGTQLPVHADIITPHNKAYYQQSGDATAAPNGTCNPVPVSFLSASGHYLVMLSGAPEDEPWIDAAMELLTLGLSHLGIGAKTNAGYGKLEPVLNQTIDLGKEREKHQRSLELAQLPLDKLLDRALEETWKSKKYAQRLADHMRQLAQGESDVQDLTALFEGKTLSEALHGYQGATTFETPGVLDALFQAMRRNLEIQAWARGEELNAKTGRRPNQLKTAAQWVGLHEDGPTYANAAAATAKTDPVTNLVKYYPQAVSLSEEANHAFAAHITADGVIDKQALNALEDKVLDWGAEALELWSQLIGS